MPMTCSLSGTLHALCIHVMLTPTTLPHPPRCCWQLLQQPGLKIMLHERWPQRLWRQSSKAKGGRQLRCQQPEQHQQHTALLPVTVEETAGLSSMLKAAGRHAIASMPHSLLVAAFENVNAGIETWPLPAVAEDSSGLEESTAAVPAISGQDVRGGAAMQDPAGHEVTLLDQTFITGAVQMEQVG